jgi:hypothetical protein
MTLRPCTKCGHQCPDDVLRCPGCGARLRWVIFRTAPVTPPPLGAVADQASQVARLVILLIIGMALIAYAMFAA